MRFVNPKTDSAFKLLFGMPSSKNLIKDFLNAVLKLQEGQLITEIEFFSNEIVSPIKDFDGNKVFIDIHCLDQRKHHYIVEMQVENQHNFIPRMLYYGCRGLWIQRVKKGDYNSLLPVIGVGIVDYKLFDNEKNPIGEPVSRYVFKHAENNQILPDSILDFYFVELPKFRKTLEELETQLDRWLYFLKNADDLTFIPDQLKSLEPAFNILNEVTWSDSQLAQYRKEEEDLGKIDRVEQGAILEGRKEGEYKKAEEIAKNLLRNNVDIAIILQSTGLSIEEIENLKIKNSF